VKSSGFGRELGAFGATELVGAKLSGGALGFLIRRHGFNCFGLCRAEASSVDCCARGHQMSTRLAYVVFFLSIVAGFNSI